ncbi:MAG TPA: DNA-formamidopyrimidine glycosylase family protein [Chloroflexota bacterium]|nr:DNA-formamidopyrimidine glycosylase family protein [Chloroflexota bacterium]
MPELPELEAVRRRFAPRVEGRVVDGVEVNPRKGFLLRSPLPVFTSELKGRRISQVWRRGKHMVYDLEAEGDLGHLVINPMLGGRFQMTPLGAKRQAAHIFSLLLDGAEELRYLDFRDMGRVYWAHDLEKEVLAWPELGPEADSLPEQGLEWFRKRLRRYRAALKDVLRDQAFLAGIGNAYSDEILFEAKILPLRKRSSLSAEEEEALFAAISGVLARATEAILANPNYEESKQDRSFMAVHGRGGEACPRCGHRISQIGSDREPMNFCRGCQV